MAASETWAAQATFARLVNKGVPAQNIKIPNLIALIPSALKRLAGALSQLPPESPKRQLLESATTVTLTAGVGDLAALETAGYLPDTIDPGKISHSSSTYMLQQVPDEAALRFPWANYFIYFCISGNKIKTRDVTGDDPLINLTGDLNVVAVKIPAITALPAQLETEFLDEMEVLALPKG
jgi:hypothetical protein